MPNDTATVTIKITADGKQIVAVAEEVKASLAGLGIPAAYVSGFLRTPARSIASRAWKAPTPPTPGCAPGAECKLGWREFYPTHVIPAGNDHITIGYGRDYGDVSPIAGVLKALDEQAATQAVDV